MTRNRYKTLAAHRLATIRQLRMRLAAEQHLNDALSRLAFGAKQEPARLKEVRRATTRRRKLLEGRAA